MSLSSRKRAAEQTLQKATGFFVDLKAIAAFYRNPPEDCGFADCCEGKKVADIIDEVMRKYGADGSASAK